MATNFLADQYNTVSRLQAASAAIIDQIHSALALAQEAIDNGYSTGGANVLTDAILQTPASGSTTAPFPKLTAQNVFDAVIQIQALDTLLLATSRLGYTRLERMRP